MRIYTSMWTNKWPSLSRVTEGLQQLACENDYVVIGRAALYMHANEHSVYEQPFEGISGIEIVSEEDAPYSEIHAEFEAMKSQSIYLPDATNLIRVAPIDHVIADYLCRGLEKPTEDEYFEKLGTNKTIYLETLDAKEIITYFNAGGGWHRPTVEKLFERFKKTEKSQELSLLLL
jgi:hypothetical protein